MLSALLLLCFALQGTLAYFPQGTISEPKNGTRISPGASFPFKYNTRSDYCMSSFNYTVWLITSTDPSQFGAFGPENTFATGHYFGRFQNANYPAVPYPTNPAPATLVMPDFSKSPGGFGVGATATKKMFYLAVMEEWAQCTGTVGKRFSLTWNPIYYNYTTS